MKYTNLHTHTRYSDGKDTIDDCIKSALSQGMGGIGFSDHTPVPIDNHWTMKRERLNDYLKEVNHYKEIYKNIIPVYLGLELDYIENQEVQKYISLEDCHLDYYIAAVHYLYIKKLGIYDTVDDSMEVFTHLLYDGFEGNMEKFYRQYYENYRQMIEKYQPSLLAHLDLIKKNNRDNRFFREDDKEYVKQVNATLDKIKEFDCIIEINTGGMLRGFTKEAYPSGWILKEANRRKIRVTLSADAHQKENIDYHFNESIESARTAGYRSIVLFENGVFKEHSI